MSYNTSLRKNCCTQRMHMTQQITGNWLYHSSCWFRFRLIWKIWSSKWIFSPGIGIIKNIWSHHLALAFWSILLSLWFMSRLQFWFWRNNLSESKLGGLKAEKKWCFLRTVGSQKQKYVSVVKLQDLLIHWITELFVRVCLFWCFCI